MSLTQTILYSTDGNFENFVIPPNQRPIVQEHVNSILMNLISGLCQKDNVSILPPIFCIKDGLIVYVVDGQHRLEAYKRVRGTRPPMLFEISFREGNKFEAERYCSMQRTTTLPQLAFGVPERELRMYDELCSRLQGVCFLFRNVSTKVNRPFINIVKLVKAYMSIRRTFSFEDLMSLLEQMNFMLSTTTDPDIKVLESCNTCNNHIGKITGGKYESFVRTIKYDCQRLPIRCVHNPPYQTHIET